MNADQKIVSLTPYSGSNRGGNPSESDIAETAHSASLSDIQNRRCGHGLTAAVQSSAVDYYGAELVRNPDGSPLLDHENKPIPIAKLLATKPLRAELLTRPGPGNRKLTYLSGDSVTRTLNDIFGFDGWCLEVKETRRESCEKDEKKRYNVSYTAIVRLTHRQTGAFKEDCGSGDSIDRSLGTAVSHALKASVTDAMKRAARHFGEKLGNSLYDTSFTLNKAPGSLKDALNTYEIERAKSKFGFEKDRIKAKQNREEMIQGNTGNAAANNPVTVRTPASKVTNHAAHTTNTSNNGSSKIQHHHQQQQYQTPHQTSNYPKNPNLVPSRTNSTSSTKSTPDSNAGIPTLASKQSINISLNNGTSNAANVKPSTNSTTKNIYNGNSNNTSNAYSVNNTGASSSHSSVNKPNVIVSGIPKNTSSPLATNMNTNMNNQNQRNQPITAPTATNTYSTNVPQQPDKSSGLVRFQQTPQSKQPLNQRQSNGSTLPGPQANSNQNYQHPPSVASSISNSAPPFVNRPRPPSSNTGSSMSLPSVSHNTSIQQRQYQPRSSYGLGQSIPPLNDITNSRNFNQNNLSFQNSNGKRTMESMNGGGSADVNNHMKPKKMVPYSGSNPYSTMKK